MSEEEPRRTYAEIKSGFLETYFDLCKERGVRQGLPHEQILGGVEDAYENVYERPVERLMSAVVQLVLSGGWFSTVDNNLRRRIAGYLDEHGLEQLLRGVPREEKDVFLDDLRRLKLRSETYCEIKRSLVTTYFSLCRDDGVRRRRSFEQTLDTLDSQYQKSFERPIECLMRSVVLLILSGGWHPTLEDQLRRSISELIASHDLKRLLSEIPEAEQRALLFDLKSLGFVEWLQR